MRCMAAMHGSWQVLAPGGMEFIASSALVDDSVVQFSLVSALHNGTRCELIMDDDEQTELRKLHMMSSGVQGKSKEEVEERVAKMKADAEEKEEHTAVFREAFVRANGLKSMLSLLKSSSQKVLETLALVLKDLAGVVATRGLMVQQGALRIGIDLHARLPDKNVGKVPAGAIAGACRPSSVV